jgi:hypothetical protein
MKTSKNDSRAINLLPINLLFLILMLAMSASGCGPRPTESVDPTELPTLLPSLSSPTPAPPPTPTLELIDGGLVYIAVGISPEGILPMYQEPSLSTPIIGQIPPSGKSIRTTGVESIADGRTWLQVEYQGVGGWVDSAYLARQVGDLPGELASLAQAVAAALKTADYYQLADFVHPVQCLRFSPYPYLYENGQTFCPDELSVLPGSDTIFTWGRYDGTGDPIELSFLDYHQRFVYDQDYLQPDVVGLNQEVSSGNAINNIPDLYPDGMIIEYHFPGFDPQYGGMDWRSLRMVFIEDKGGWFLVALVHGEWTI